MMNDATLDDTATPQLKPETLEQGVSKYLQVLVRQGEDAMVAVQLGKRAQAALDALQQPEKNQASITSNGNAVECPKCLRQFEKRQGLNRHQAYCKAQ